MVNPNLATATIKAASHTTSRALSAHFGDVINVRGMGALGNGVADDRAAIQAAFDLAYGSTASPHGNALKFQNRPVYIPAGDYRIGGPLYLNKVYGGFIFGDGASNTKLTYTGALSGNAFVANGITPLIITDGWCYSRFEGMHLSISGTDSTSFYLYWNGAGGAGPTGNVFQTLLVEGFAGILIGYQTPGLCSETTFISCAATGCTYGFRNISSNALNNVFIGCGADHCTTGFSCPTGSIQIYTASLAVNSLDIATGQLPMVIMGTRTESSNFVDTSASGGVSHIISGCEQETAGAGYFANLGGSNKVIIDACVQVGATSTFGRIAGSGTSKLYLRGSTFENTGYLATFTGTVAQNI